jgi:hypothetical protein
MSQTDILAQQKLGVYLAQCKIYTGHYAHKGQRQIAGVIIRVPICMHNPVANIDKIEHGALHGYLRLVAYFFLLFVGCVLRHLNRLHKACTWLLPMAPNQLFQVRNQTFSPLA